MKIAIASDHRAVDIKAQVINHLQRKGHFAADVGPHEEGISVDYPDYAQKAVRAFKKGEVERIVLMCGTGIGMSIAANRFSDIRAALVTCRETAKFSRAHNNANTICLSANLLTVDQIIEYIDLWLETPFEGGRHEIRLAKIEQAIT